MVQTIIIHHNPTIISSILTFSTKIPPNMVQNIIIPPPTNEGKMRIYCNLSPLSPKRTEKPKMRMGQKPCTIKYHGSKNLGSSYKYIVKVSPQIFLHFLVIPKTFHLSPLFPYFFHIIQTVYVEFSPYPLRSISLF